ncbi:hypothetical protein [Streptomyces prunicolor]|uniref:hypothetical protein n=1 Tax=Streptomyces prunicolor TaxID=67348 RepID=UPI0033C68C5C
MLPTPTPSSPALGGSRWNTFPAVGTTLTARIEITNDGTTAHVDFGQALRGHRFADRPDPTAGDTHSTVAGSRSAAVWAAPRAPGLVWTQAGDVTLDATGPSRLVTLVDPPQAH